MNINFDYYRIFYYVAKYGNFTQAAEWLMNNQPNLTRMIHNLESQLGCSLFVRSNRGVKLTPEGQRLYEHVKIAVNQIETGEKELMRLADLQSGTLSIGASEVALRCFLLPVLKEYQKCYPQIRLKVSNHSTPQAVAALQSGIVDIAFVTTMASKHKGLTVKPIMDINEIAVCGSAFLNLTGRKLSLEEFAQYPLISLGAHSQTFQLYEEVFQRHGLAFSPDIEAATADQILPMVKNNLGVSFVPEEFLKDDEPTDIYRLDLTAEFPRRAICCVELPGKPLSLAAKELEKLVFHRKNT